MKTLFGYLRYGFLSGFVVSYRHDKNNLPVCGLKTKQKYN